jgi:hypothetical protein
MDGLGDLEGILLKPTVLSNSKIVIGNAWRYPPVCLLNICIDF